MQIKELDGSLVVYRADEELGCVHLAMLEVPQELREKLELEELRLLERYLLLRQMASPTPLHPDEMAVLPSRVRKAASWARHIFEHGSTPQRREAREFVDAMLQCFGDFEAVARGREPAVMPGISLH